MKDLHSTMVRFIILANISKVAAPVDLHSTIVRFIMSWMFDEIAKKIKFTFHYG